MYQKMMMTMGKMKNARPTVKPGPCPKLLERSFTTIT